MKYVIALGSNMEFELVMYRQGNLYSCGRKKLNSGVTAYRTYKTIEEAFIDFVIMLVDLTHFDSYDITSQSSNTAYSSTESESCFVQIKYRYRVVCTFAVYSDQEKILKLFDMIFNSAIRKEELAIYMDETVVRLRVYA